jgi:hypothetical protein
VEVVNCLADQFDQYEDKFSLMKDLHGDIKAQWEILRPCYKRFQVRTYEGAKRVGRFVHPNIGVSGIITWPRGLRDSILAYGYNQYDMAHALPSIIFHYFKDLNLHNLAHAITLINDASGSSRQDLKNVVTRVLQGCSVPNSDQYLDIMQCDWFDGLVMEAKGIHEAIKDRYPGFVDLVKEKRRRDGKDAILWPATAVQMFYDDVESILQEEAAAKLGGKNILINCDALFVPTNTPGDVLRILNDLHADKGVVYVHKPMNRIVDIPNIEDAILRVQGGVSADAQTGAYGEWKVEFEKSNFYLSEKNKFVTINHRTKKLYYTSAKEMMDSRYAYSKDFVKMWIEDSTRLTYDNIVNCPPPNVCGAQSFNLWGFNSNFRAATLPPLAPDDDLDQLVEPIIEMFRCIVSHNNDHFTYLINYMADSLQNPGIKRAQYIGMYGQQGVGKNELMERFWMDKIIGHDLTATYKSVAEWAGQFEDGWQSAMWVMVHEADYKDFSSYYQFLKGVTGSLMQKSNTKYGVQTKVAFYGRIIMLSNYVNAFNEDNLISRRQGMRCIASSFRGVPNSMQILNSTKHQRAFYDYLMDIDLDGWDPEINRVDSDIMREANFMTTFRKEQGNMMTVLMHLVLDKLYETYRKIDTSAEIPEYLKEFQFPAQIIYKPYYAICGLPTDTTNGNAHYVNMAAMVSQLDSENPTRLAKRGTRARFPWWRNDKQKASPSIWVDYPALKKALADKVEKYNLSAYIDLDQEKETALSFVDEYHQELIKENWVFRPVQVRTLLVPKTKTAHFNKAGESPKYVIKQNGDVVFGSDNPEEINRELGEAWVEECEEAETERVVQILHVGNKDIYLDNRYMVDYGKIMLELRFPAYVRNRAT